jgi:ElaB/YqjD/DUF883 family membrane-anchored ribosome-binding protein
MEGTHTSNENIAEALKLLEEAAKQKKDELKSVLSDKYTHLRGLIVGVESDVAKRVGDTKNHALEVAAHVQEIGVEKAREVNKSAHQNPWVFIGGATVISLLFGYILGRNSK